MKQAQKISLFSSLRGRKSQGFLFSLFPLAVLAATASAAFAQTTLSASSLSFGNVAVNTTSATQSLVLKNTGSSSVTIKGINISGSSDYTLVSSATTCPSSGSLAGNATCQIGVSLRPAKVGAESNTLLNVTTTANNVLPLVNLSGTGVATQAKLSGFSCASGSITGAGTDNCTVTLSAAVGSSGQAVSLVSNNTSVKVPSSVTVASGASTASFTATIAAVSAAQTATLTASSGGGSSTYAISLAANSSSTVATLTLQSTSIAFGEVALNSPSYQTETLTSSGTASLTISAGAVAGTGFSMSGVTFPLTLSPGQTATLEIEFDPTVSGSASGTVTLTSNSSTGAASQVSLSGTGEQAATSYQVDLNWNAPSSSPVEVAGYNVYRATGSSTLYELVNTSVDTSTSYTDATVASNTSYSYYVESVDAAGTQSSPSNSYSVSIP